MEKLIVLVQTTVYGKVHKLFQLKQTEICIFQTLETAVRLAGFMWLLGVIICNHIVIMASYAFDKRIRFDSLGNIGIGTNKPQAKVDISGNVSITGNIFPSSNVTYDLGSSTQRWKDLYLSGTTIDLSGTTISRDTNGGIKITDPFGNPLNGTFGNLLPSANVTYDLGSPDYRWKDLYLSGNTIDLSGTRLSRHTDGSLMVHDASGNYMTGRFNHVTTTGNISSIGNISTSANVGVGTDNPAYKLHVIGDTRIQGDLTIDGTQTMVNTDIQVTDQVVITNAGTGPALVVTQSGVQPIADFCDETSGNVVMRVANGGNVGIGTSNPQAKIHVNGNAVIGSSGSSYLTINDIDGARYRIFTGGYNLTFSQHTSGETYATRFSIKNGGGVDVNGSITQTWSDYRLGIFYDNSYRQGMNYYTAPRQLNIFSCSGDTGGDITFSTTRNYTAPNDSNYGTQRMIITGNGYVGIANSNPQYPLDIASSALTSSFTANYWNINSLGNVYTQQWYVAIKTTQYIWSSAGFIAASDIRIKTNVQDINDETALNQLRLLQPKTYEYIDKVQRGSDPVIGFIAQEVAEVIPRAVTKQKEFIPSVYAIASVTHGAFTPNESFVNGTLQLEKEHGFVVGDKVKLIKKDGGELITTVKDIISPTTFTIEEACFPRPASDTIEDERIFVYGKEVQDFHTLDKNAIFTIGVAAVQELDRQVQQLKAENVSILERLTALEQRL
jgi:hypothetical protein